MSNAQMNMPFVVKEFFGSNQVLHAMGNQLTTEGMVLDNPATLLEQYRFMWLEFTLPGSSAPIRALGEVVGRDEGSVQVKFKHVFPDQKRKLASYFASQVSMN